jgi:hypothetical protein
MKLDQQRGFARATRARRTDLGFVRSSGTGFLVQQRFHLLARVARDRPHCCDNPTLRSRFVALAVEHATHRTDRVDAAPQRTRGRL